MNQNAAIVVHAEGASPCGFDDPTPALDISIEAGSVVFISGSVNGRFTI